MRSGILITQSNPNVLMNKFNSKTLEESLFQLLDQKIPKLATEKIETIVEDSNISNIKTNSALNNKINRKLIDFSNLKALTIKSYIRMKGNPLSIFLFYFLPFIQITALKICFGQNPINSPIAIYNGEVVPNFSQIFIDNIDRKYISPKFYETNETAINTVINGKNWFAITFAENFSECFETRFSDPNDATDEELDLSEIKLYADMSNTIISQKIYAQLLSSFEKFLQNLSSTLGFNRETVSQPIIIENEFYGSQDSPFTDFFAPGILMVCISTMPLIVASFMLVKERRGGHLERVFVADVKPSEILLINIIMLFIANVFQVLLLLILAFYIYDLTLRGSFFNAFGLIVSQCMQWTSFGYFLSLCFADEYSVMVCFE
jgi:hypothetical protein